VGKGWGEIRETNCYFNKVYRKIRKENKREKS